MGEDSCSLIGNRHRFAQLASQRLQPVVRVPIRVRFGRIGVDDERNLAREIIDHGQLFGEQQQHVGNVGKLFGKWWRRCCELSLDMANDVVAEIAGESTAEAWQPEFGGGTVAPQKGSDELEWIALVALDDTAAILDLDR